MARGVVPRKGFDMSTTSRTVTLPAAATHPMAPAIGLTLLLLATATPAAAQGSGSIGADPNPCLIPDGDDHCHPLIVWDSSGVTDPKVSITVSGAWGTNVFQCADANQPGSQQTVGVQIGVVPKIFGLYAVPDCAVDPLVAGALLAEAEVAAYPPGSVVCPVDNQLLASDDPDYLGLIGNATIPSTPDLPFIAAELAEARVRQWRRTVQWLQLEPDPPSLGVHDYDWPRFDSLFLPMAAEGVAPWITLSHTAVWAADLPAGGDPSDAFKYPPVDVQDWRDFVRAVAERYGPGGILATPARHWDIWQEPDLTSFFLGTPADYVELLNAAYDEIHQVDPGATVWAGNLVFVPDRPAAETEPWIDAIFTSGLFDGFAIHPFFREVADYHAAIAAMRAWIDSELGPGVPLAVTATSYLLGNDPCAFAALPAAERAAFVLDVYACGAGAGARHVHWFKTIDRQPPGGECKLDANGAFSPARDGSDWRTNANFESLRRIGDHLNPSP